MGYELEHAKMEAARNEAVDAYMKARPQLDYTDNRRIFESGFERAWNLRQKEIDALTVPNAGSNGPSGVAAKVRVD